MQKARKIELNQKQVVGTILIISLMLTIVSLGTYQYVIATFQGSESSVPKYLESTLPFSYIIDTNTTHYFAYNGTTWKKDYSGTNARAVIQSCLDALQSVGGKILLKNADYVLDDTPLRIWSNTVLEGESWKAKLIGGTGLPTWQGVIMNKYAGTTTQQDSNIVIRNLQIDGQMASVDPGVTRPGGIFMSGVKNVIIENNYIHDTMNFHVRIYQWTSTGPKSSDIQIRNNFLETSAYNGIMVEAETVGDVYNVLVDGNVVTDTDTGISTTKGKNIVFSNNIAYDNINDELFVNRIDIAVESYSEDVFITGNLVFGSKNYTADSANGGINVNGIQVVHSTVKRVSIIGNHVLNKTFVGINAHRDAENVEIKNNYVYLPSTWLNSWFAIADGFVIQNNYITGNWGGGIKAQKADALVADNQIMNLRDMGVGSIRAYANNVTIKDNYIWDDAVAVNTRAIRTEADINGTRILNNQMINFPVGIQFSTGNDDVIVEGNEFRNVTTKISGTPTNFVVRRNFGYVTENSGSQTVANGENIAHGLVSTPVYVSVTCGNATYDGVPIVVGYTALDSTNIQVSVYWTNGTAITADVILVMWEARTWN